MKTTRTIFALSAVSFFLAGVSSAQSPVNKYDFQWAPMNDTKSLFYTSTVSLASLFGPSPSGTLAFRKCYSVDVTQGGRNQSNSQFESTWFRLFQGFAPANPIPGVDIGLVSLQAATESDLGGDACLSPWFSSVGNTGGHHIAAAAMPGLQSFTSAFPYPAFWDLAFQWNVNPVTGIAVPVTGPNTIGMDPTNPFGAPLLANVIFEIQGPTASASSSNQYFLYSFNEQTGQGTSSAIPGRGTGGVTNGNSAWGTSIFGVPANVSGATSHSRFLFSSPTTGVIGGTLPIPNAGTAEVLGQVAFVTPFLWAENDGSIGAGGPDWNIASGTPSNVQLWLKDIEGGAEGTSNVNYKIGGVGGPTANYNPDLLLNFSYFFWSVTPASSMQQLPMSWSDALGMPTPGSIEINTSREGLQRLPLTIDAMTTSLLNTPGLSQGTPFSNAEMDPIAHTQSTLFEGDFNNANPIVSGISKLTLAGGAAFPVASSPIPSFGGLNIGVAAVGVQVISKPGGPVVKLTEFGNGLTLTLQ